MKALAYCQQPAGHGLPAQPSTAGTGVCPETRGCPPPSSAAGCAGHGRQVGQGQAISRGVCHPPHSRVMGSANWAASTQSHAPNARTVAATVRCSRHSFQSMARIMWTPLSGRPACRMTAA